MGTKSPNIETLIGQAKGGDLDALGALLEVYRNYLRLMTRLHLHGNLRGKISESDLVQETFLCARRGFSEFRGSCERELLGWLRSILAAQLANTTRHFTSQRRNIHLERRLNDQLDQSSLDFASQFASRLESPSEAVSRRERAVLLADALNRLNRPQREVIIMRHLDGLAFADIAERTERTLDSVKSLWTRAIQNLQRILRDLE